MKSISEILRATCAQYRKGEEVIINGRPATTDEIEASRKGEDTQYPDTKGGVAKVEIFDMPAVADAPEGIYLVDTHFIVVGVDVAKATELKPDLIAWMTALPSEYKTALEGGPSYITMGGIIGDQGMALCLFALGEALEMWQVITPEKMHITGEQADQLAGAGMVMMTGWHDSEGVSPEAEPVAG